MKILQLCKKFPFPLKDGESIAVTNLSKSLKNLGCEITLLAMNTSKHYMDIQLLPENFKEIYATIKTVGIDNHIKPWGAFLNLFEKESYHVTRFISKDFEKQLIETLQSNVFDVVQLETIFLAPYIPIIRKYSNALVAIRSHNVEHEIWERVSQTSTNLFKRYYLKLLNPKLKRFETTQLNNCDVLLPITERDLLLFRKLGFNKKAIVTPLGIEDSDYRLREASTRKPFAISFIGSLDWMPNQEGLKWFLDNVWKPFFKEDIEIEFHIAGRNAPAWISTIKQKNIFFHGEIENAHKFLAQRPVMIAPLFAGSGIRVKILESMALERVVISTSLGLEGVNATDNKEVIIADTPEQFRDAILFCKENPLKAKKIGSFARNFVIKSFDGANIALNVLKTYQSLIPAKIIQERV